MTKEELFEIWAPPNGLWSPWVKPVLFAFLDRKPEWSVPPARVDFNTDGFPPAQDHAALVLDLPGAEGVRAGMALAAQGYRPVPLYNAVPDPTLSTSVLSGTNAATALVDAASILVALWHEGDRLHGLNVPPNGPPAFLLDADRRCEGFSPSPGQFDNRSISFITDFPSATFLASNHISRVVLIQSGRDDPQPDLAHTLQRWQDGGIALELKRVDVVGPARPIQVRPPRGFGMLWQRALGMLGLRRHGLGGFGGIVPTPSAG